MAKLTKCVKILKSAKIMLMMCSVLASAFVYGASMGWLFGIGLTVMIGIHEYGHILACKIKRIPASLPVFIPMLGAAIFIPKISSRHDEAYVGIGGPVVGSLAAVAVFIIYLLSPEKPAWLLSVAMLSVAMLGTFLNLFNLIPISPLDDGRIMQSITKFGKYIGGTVLFAFTMLANDPGLPPRWSLNLRADNIAGKS